MPDYSEQPLSAKRRRLATPEEPDELSQLRQQLLDAQAATEQCLREERHRADLAIEGERQRADELVKAEQQRVQSVIEIERQQANKRVELESKRHAMVPWRLQRSLEHQELLRAQISLLKGKLAASAQAERDVNKALANDLCRAHAHNEAVVMLLGGTSFAGKYNYKPEDVPYVSKEDAQRYKAEAIQGNYRSAERHGSGFDDSGKNTRGKWWGGISWWKLRQ